MPSQKQVEERVENISSILAHLRANGAKSRRQLSEELHLSWGCISELSSILIGKGILLEEEIETVKGKGRKPSVLNFNPKVCFLGVDINIRGISACVCNLFGEKLFSTAGKIETDSKQEFISSVIEFVNSVVKDRDNILGIAFAMQGIFNKKVNAWEFPLKEKVFVDFSSDFKDAFKIPFFVEHDPNCILYGCFDETQGSKMILRIDSGVGAAIYKNGQFLSDELLEIGYLVINDKGERLFDILSPHRFDTEKDNGEYIAYASRALGVTLGNICNLFRLDEIYLCGDIVTNYNLLNAALKAAYSNTVIASQAAEITLAQITDAAYGAAKLAIDRFKY